MSKVRRQSIISTFIIYTGFFIGLINNYFLLQKDYFSTEEYGLYSAFQNIAILIAAVAPFGSLSYIYKFYPYYHNRVPDKKSDLLGIALLLTLFGFVVIGLFGFIFKDIIVAKYSVNSKLFVDYYAWMFPFGLGLTLFGLLEAFTWTLRKPVVTNTLREVVWRLIVLLLIILFIKGAITNFSLFFKIFSFSYFVIIIALIIYLISLKKLYFNFKLSNVTRKFKKKIISFTTYAFGASIVFNLAQIFDTLVIMSVLEDGLAKAGVYSLAQLMGSVIQAPQRAVITSSVVPLAHAWKDKNIQLIRTIYQRSSINLFIFSLGIFLLILLNYQEAIITFKLNADMLNGFSVFIFIGLTRVTDMGTGVNAQIIGTSSKFRFEFYSGIVLLLFMLPLSYILAHKYDMLGPAIANLISVCIYNFIRIVFLWKKFRLFPFSMATLYTLITGAAIYSICYFLFRDMHSWIGLFARSICFVVLYATCVYTFNFSPDVKIVLNTILTRLGVRKK